MGQSATKTIKAADWKTVSSLTNITFNNSKTYNLYVVKQCEFKVGDAIFPAFNRQVFYDPNVGTLYIKTGGTECRLTVLENA